ncbi:DUF429 domain-containing protein [Phaeodactylibacter xiamenensis]|uniref:DUF429 domain-containing protein n=1 Tax=Phaeodactylibacter xiamenensis TaxID=1524460 RepID=UPI0024A80391|nr:DUF429 domain-containing protein [Phaeodactylibacter xiamenensis]
MNWAGVDYGSKMAGTTVIAWAEGRAIRLAQSAAKKDADKWVKSWVEAHRPAVLYLDAPLSLPGVYHAPGGYEDFFYRAADKEVQAMSPMFLGGLTARAMRLSQELKALQCTTLEVYPGQLSKILGLDRKRYKKDKAYLQEATEMVLAHLPDYQMATPPTNWHQVDALLAFCSGYRHQQGLAAIYGGIEEGQIIV